MVVEEIIAALRDLKGEGLAILLVEQNLNLALSLADRHLIMSKGVVCFSGSSQELASNEEITRTYLAV